MFVLQADSIGKSYGERSILTAATLQADQGQIVAVVGRMGAGKSTLLKICAGLVAPDSGWVKFEGVLYHRPRLFRIAPRGMFFLPERGNLGSSLSVGEHFRLLGRRYGDRGSTAALEALDVRPLLARRAHALSGGERQRVELALAIARNPSCLLVDELFRGLDPLTCELVGAALQRLAYSGCAVVATGHEVESLAQFASGIVWVTAGTTYSLGDPRTAASHEAFRREYLGSAALAPNKEA